jgi:hypothetical protein
VVGIAVLAGSTARATSIVPPENLGELARVSHATVLVQAGYSQVIPRGPLLFTLTTFQVMEVVAGGLATGDRLTVEAPGGELDGNIWMVPGSPRFEPGQVYLLFLDQKPSGEWLPETMAYGLLRRVTGRDGSNLLAPLAEEAGIQPFLREDGILPEPVETYREPVLLPHLRAVAQGREAWDSRKVRARSEQVPMEVYAQAIPSGCSFMSYDGTNMRWQVFDTGGSATIQADETGDNSTSPPGGGFTEIQAALSDWNGIASTSIDVSYGGKISYTLTCTSGQDYPGSGESVVVFNDPCNDIPGISPPPCSGTLGFGGPWVSSTHQFDGTTWYTITSWFVVLNNGVGCLNSTYYKLMVEHELGHGLGFGHYSDPLALMYSMCCNNINSTDTTCAQYTYPGSGNPAPTVTGVNPSSGSTAGGTGITITGTGFLTGATVTLGGTAATGVTVSNSTTITATTPAHSAGAVNVVVTNTDGKSGTKTNGFTYVSGPPPPSVSSVYPNFGPAAGGTGITITGSSFVTGATATLGGTAATGVTVSNSTTITATTAAHTTGSVNVVVQNPDAQTGTLVNGYFYGPPTTTGALFYPLTPCRVLDTRNATGPLGGPVLAAGATRSFTVASTCAIPSNAKTLSVNLTITGPTATGELRVFPGNGTLPSTSSISFRTGQTRANNAHVLLATDGTGSFKVQNNSTGTVHFLVDVNGYYR